MFPIILNTSKTMIRPVNPSSEVMSTEPRLIEQATLINSELQTLDKNQIKKIMKISDSLADKVIDNIAKWRDAQKFRAVEYFAGDIYKGFDVSTFSDKDLRYSQQRLVILSGQYGILRALDLIAPYRMEMGYALKVGEYDNLYQFWADNLNGALPRSRTYLNVTSEEYFKTIRHIFYSDAQIVAPVFLTEENGVRKQATLFTKNARGAMASWVIHNRIEDISKITDFNLDGYVFDPEASTKLKPVFVRQR